ncbi:M23 family metallopeptidase [Sphingomonas sp. LB-2]|uniref:M23 family metallopeptidase n=1 Tax=Sphingomonas caeni TaxID=2984949 RepID=UPI002231A5B1|nr:M23 family metallopeptidase [Sphingomonas caeni]MCW3846530.1 M23 family metallopeptidase [Sphingomonas caeni]
MTLSTSFHSDHGHAGGYGTTIDNDPLWGQRALFTRNDYGLEGGGGSAKARPGLIQRHFPDLDLTPDLGSRIGTLTWYRGAATCIGLCALTFLMSPGFENPIYGFAPAALKGKDYEATRAQSIAPLAKGATTGYHMAATKLVAPLADTPERPQIEINAKLAQGGSLMSVLKRSGVGGGDADATVALIGKALALGDIEGGVPVDITLGRRSDKTQPRPLQALAFRARFDLNLQITRGANGELSLKEMPIRIDNTPLRVQGEFGQSLYRAARAAGAPAKAVESFIRSVGTRMPISRMGAGCRFDIIVEQARAETGEVRMGELMYAGITGCSNKMQLVRMTIDGRDEWVDSSGRGERRGSMAMPTPGRISSGFGMRRHPILGYVRMHKGMDIAAPWGTPVYAASDGVVQFAGRASGYGNLIRIAHAGPYGTGYGHLSRITVRPGQRVRRGQLIGAVGNVGLSTGPHLHYELYRNGIPINPRSVAFSVERQLDGGAMAALRSRLGRLMAVPVGAGARPHEDDED